MKRFLTKHGILVLSAATAVAVVLSLVSFFSSNTDLLTNIVNTVSTPFRSASVAVAEWVGEKLRYASEYDAMKERIQELELEIAKMEEQLRQAEADSDENQRLRKLLDLREQQRDLQWESARVIQRDASNWEATLSLNVGTDFGVEVGKHGVLGQLGLGGDSTFDDQSALAQHICVDFARAFGVEVELLELVDEMSRNMIAQRYFVAHILYWHAYGERAVFLYNLIAQLGLADGKHEHVSVPECSHTAPVRGHNVGSSYSASDENACCAQGVHKGDTLFFVHFTTPEGYYFQYNQHSIKL